MFAVPYFIFITVAACVMWWLSGYDSQVTGEDKAKDFTRRAIRCGISLVLLTMAAFGGFLTIPIAVILGIIWAGPGAEFISRQIHKLIDPEDKREFDPKEMERRLDRLAQLVREGRNREAVVLCHELETERDASPLMLETAFLHLYQQVLETMERSIFLDEVRHFRALKQIGPAEQKLLDLLKQQPENWEATLLLARIYAQDLAQPNRARAVLQQAGKSVLPSQFVKLALQSVDEWSEPAINRAEPAPAKGVPSRAAEAPEISINELLKSGQLATAIEHLENALKEQPQDAEIWLKLAEAYAVYCADAGKAAKVIRQMEATSMFTAEEMQSVRASLKEWQMARRSQQASVCGGS